KMPALHCTPHLLWCRAKRRARSGRGVRDADDAADGDGAGVRSIVLTRAAEYNTITPALRDELAAAIDEADADDAVRVILLRAEGPAFCAGYGLDWSTAAQSGEQEREQTGGRVWDSVQDLAVMSRY